MIDETENWDDSVKWAEILVAVPSRKLGLWGFTRFGKSTMRIWVWRTLVIISGAWQYNGQNIGFSIERMKV